MAEAAFHLRFRDYRTANGRRVVMEEIRKLPLGHRAVIVAAMKDVERRGLAGCRHIGGELYEKRANLAEAHYRLIFSQESKFVLLALHLFDKDTTKLPVQVRRLAEDRLRDWRQRGAAKK